MAELARVGEEVAEALAVGWPVVALETTLIVHGLPRPDNLVVAAELERIVREEGAVPATIGVVEGVAVIGLSTPEIERLATRDGVAKLSVRDRPGARRRRRDHGGEYGVTRGARWDHLVRDRRTRRGAS